MAENKTPATRSDKTGNGRKSRKFDLKAFSQNTIKRLKAFFVSLKAELKRVIWPDRKKLQQTTLTVLAICLLTAIILFVIDQALALLLNGVGFYNPAATTTTVTETTAATTTAEVTTTTTAAN